MGMVLLLTWTSYAQYQAANWIVPTYRKVVNIKPGVFSVDTLASSSSSLRPVVSIANGNGDLLAFSTGYDLRDRDGNLVENGCCLCDSGTQSQCSFSCSYGTTHMQGAIILPKPGSSTQYLLFIKNKPVTSNCQPSQVTCTIFDMSYNNGLGKVIQKGLPIFNGVLSDARLAACRHGNGRDWWLINHDYNTNRIYTHLVTPDSIYGPYSQLIGGNGKEPDNCGWSVFSQNGFLFATTTCGMSNYTSGTGISLFDFDRCAGMFSNYRTIQLDTTMTIATYSSFLAFSPNSRFLYSGSNNYLYQYDLDATDISASGVRLAYDSLPPYLGMMNLMPDGKIYLPGWSASSTGLDACFSVIDQPDLKAPACSFQLRSMCVPGGVQIISAPNFPNYNLGALVGSGCDTLQTGLSETEMETEKVRVYPNPANELLQVEVNLNVGEKGTILFYNAYGTKVRQFKVTGGTTKMRIDLTDLQSGAYTYCLSSAGKDVGRGKVIVVH